MDAFCTGFTDFILKVKSPLDYTNLFSSNIYSLTNMKGRINKIILFSKDSKKD